MRGMRTICRTTLAVIVIGVVVASCSSKTADPTAQASGPAVSDVGKVVVTIASNVDAGNQKILTEVNAAPRLQAAVQGELTKAGKFKASSPRAIEIQITEFRLRSGATVFMAGIMAGVDSLGVQVNVRDGAKVIRQFKTGDSSSGAFGGLTSSSRFQPMADAVAERITKEL